MHIVTGTFSSRTAAQSARPDLERLGIPASKITIVEGSDRKGFDREHLTTRTAARRGALVGFCVGVALGAALLAISRVQPVFALRPMALYLAEILIATGGGALVFALWNMGISHDAALLYEEARATGSVIAAVEVADPVEDRVARALEEHGARDVRRGNWSPPGWTHSYPDDTAPAAEVRG